MILNLPASADVHSVHVTLDDGSQITLYGDGTVHVSAGSFAAYDLKLPSVDDVASACTAKYGKGSEFAAGNGEVDITLTVIHKH